MTILKSTVLAAALVVSLLEPASAHEIKFGDIVIGHPWAKPVPAAHGVVAGFMLLMNNGTADDRLIRATAEIAPTVRLQGIDTKGGAAKMTDLKDGIVIPAGGEVDLKPKSLHLMLLGVTTHLMEGETFKGTLTFEKAGTVDIEFEVEGSMDMN